VRYRRTGKRDLSYQTTKGRVADVTARTTTGSHCPAQESFAHILLAGVKNKMTAARHKEQSGFTPFRSTIGRISALNLILQGRLEYL